MAVIERLAEANARLLEHSFLPVIYEAKNADIESSAIGVIREGCFRLRMCVERCCVERCSRAQVGTAVARLGQHIFFEQRALIYVLGLAWTAKCILAAVRYI